MAPCDSLPVLPSTCERLMRSNGEVTQAEWDQFVQGGHQATVDERVSWTRLIAADRGHFGGPFEPRLVEEARNHVEAAVCDGNRRTEATVWLQRFALTVLWRGDHRYDLKSWQDFLERCGDDEAKAIGFSELVIQAMRNGVEPSEEDVRRLQRSTPARNRSGIASLIALGRIQHHRGEFEEALATLQLAAHREASPLRQAETQALIDGLRLWDPGITLPRAMDDLQRGQLDRACGALKQGHGWHAWDTHREVQTRVALLIAQKCM